MQLQAPASGLAVVGTGEVNSSSLLISIPHLMPVLLPTLQHTTHQVKQECKNRKEVTPGGSLLWEIEAHSHPGMNEWTPSAFQEQAGWSPLSLVETHIVQSLGAHSKAACKF